MLTVSKGIDISSHQGDIDFFKVKNAGCSYVIIKAGQGFQAMDTFRQKYLPAVLAAGLDWGAYWWSDAVTVSEARQEAVAFLQALKGLKPAYPVYMDQEYDSPCGKWGAVKNKQLRTDMIKAFLDTLQNAGYYAALYSSADWLQNWVFDCQLSQYDKWVAQYASKCTYQALSGTVTVFRLRWISMTATGTIPELSKIISSMAGQGLIYRTNLLPSPGSRPARS